MAYRPYPNADRARRQVDRHARYVDVPMVTLSPAAARIISGYVEAFRSISPLPAILRPGSNA